MNENQNTGGLKSPHNKGIEENSKVDSIEFEVSVGRIIHESSQVRTDDAYQEVFRKIYKHSGYYKLLTIFIRIAAVFTIPLLVFTLWTLFAPKVKDDIPDISESQITWQEISSPIGMRSHIVLPDGTNVWLNAGSNLRYGIPFIREAKEVELSGEAYLDVVKNEKSPFIVKTSHTEIEVLGTKFNINAYPGNENVQMALKEGKIKFRFEGDAGNKKYFELSPNDVIEFDTQNKKIFLENTNVEKYIAWHQNIMILDDTPMTELAKILEKWYGVNVTIANEDIKRYKYTTTFNNEPLHRVLELLEMSSPGISFLYEPGKPVEGNRKFSPSVVTITKNIRV